MTFHTHQLRIQICYCHQFSLVVAFQQTLKYSTSLIQYCNFYSQHLASAFLTATIHNFCEHYPAGKVVLRQETFLTGLQVI